LIPSVCTTCLRSGILCERCQEKLDNGEITQLDLDVAKKLLIFERENPNIKKVELLKTIDAGNMVVLQVSKKSIPILMTMQPNPLDYLEKEMQKTIRVIPLSQKSSRVVTGVLSPIEVLGLDTIFVPDGTTEKKIRLSKMDESRLPSSIDSLERLLHQITGERFRIIFD
jgi:transcription antitermination factor NusA-like protein